MERKGEKKKKKKQYEKKERKEEKLLLSDCSSHTYPWPPSGQDPGDGGKSKPKRKKKKRQAETKKLNIENTDKLSLLCCAVPCRLPKGCQIILLYLNISASS